MTIFFGSKVCQLTCEEWLTMLWLSLHDNQLLSADVRLALHVVVFVTTHQKIADALSIALLDSTLGPLD